MDHTLFMAEDYQRYMTWTACPALNSLILSSKPAVVLSEDGQRVLWSNQPGAALLGRSTLTTLLGDTLSKQFVLPRQIEHLSAWLHGTQEQIQRLRLNIDAARPLELTRVRKIRKQDGANGLLLIPVIEAPELPISKRAQSLVQWLEAPNFYAALLSAEGTVVAQCGKFQDLHYAYHDLETLLEKADESHEGAKRYLENAQKIGHVVHVIKLQHEGEHHFLVLACRLEAPKQTNSIPDVRSPAQLQTTSQTDVSDRIMRFVWRMDDASRFTFVSPEFQDLVRLRGAFEGRTWQDIAQDYQLDPAGSIQRAIQSKDMWTGKTFVWHLPKRHLKIHVELSATPVFSGNHLFQGYRGFGTCDIQSAPALKQVEAPTHAVNQPALETQTETGTPPPTLSTSEKNAFQAVASELRAKIKAHKDNLVQTRHPLSKESTPNPVPDSRTSHAEKAPDTDFAHILNRIKYGILIVQDEVIVYANKYLVNLIGYDDLSQFMADKHKASIDEFLSASDSHKNGTMTLKNIDGHHHHVKAIVHKTSWQTKAASLFLFEPLALNNQTAHNEWNAEDLLSILNTATEGVLMIDTEGQILALNHSAEALFGEDEEKLRTHSLLDLLAPESHQSALDYLKSFLNNGVASILNDGREVIGRTAQGGYMPLFMTMGQVGDGRSSKLCVVLRDITQWKRAEGDLIAARHKAEKESAAKSEFLARMSHEIRTPLNAILGFSEIMLEERFGSIGNARYKDYINDIHTSGTHVINLISDLLDISKIEANQMELNFTAVDLIRILKECVALMQIQANEAKIIIRTSFSEQLPRIVADSKTMKQIVLNLLSNAIKFTQAGGQVIVSTQLEQSGSLSLKIRDTGLGMSKTDMLTAMKPFQQLKPMAEPDLPHTQALGNRLGTGLGLPLTKALVEANRAKFHIESMPGEGTLIRIIFPNTRVLAE